MKSLDAGSVAGLCGCGFAVCTDSFNVLTYCCDANNSFCDSMFRLNSQQFLLCCSFFSPKTFFLFFLDLMFPMLIDQRFVVICINYWLLQQIVSFDDVMRFLPVNHMDHSHQCQVF